MGYNIIDEKNTYIDEDVVIGENSIIHPFVFLKGKTIIGKNTEIKPFTTIVNSTIGDNVIIDSSNIEDNIIGNGTKIGPMANLRPGNNIGDSCRIGNFVEVKNSNLGNNVKASHLTYIGDADLGNDINLGCGVVFVNYDGANKYRSTVKDGSFIGCNVNIVSPVLLAEDTYVAAGSTVTIDSEQGDLIIARERERIIKNWKKPVKKGEE